MLNNLYLKDDNTYILNLDAALNFPEILDIDHSTPICKKLIIPIALYNQKLRVWETDDDDRGAIAIELSQYLIKITDNSTVVGVGEEFFFEFTYPDSGAKIILDPRNHDGSSSSNTVHTIACAKVWDATIITSQPSMITDAKLARAKAYFLSPSIYTGYRVVDLPLEYEQLWIKSTSVDISDWECFANSPLLPNEFVEFRFPTEAVKDFKNVGMYNPESGTLDHLKYFNSSRVPMNIEPKNARQAMAFEATYAPIERGLTACIFYGAAGCGKTFIPLVGAIAQSGIDYTAYVPEEKKNQKYPASSMRRRENAIYDQIWACPPDRMMGDKLGAVPGDRWAKLRDNLDGYYHNIQAFLTAQRNKKEGGEQMTSFDIVRQAESIMKNINITSAGQLNGDSFTNTVFLLDEAEFFKEYQIRTATERINTGSRIFICGDPTQIRNAYGWYGNPLARFIRRVAGDKNVVILKFDGDLTQRDGAKIIYRSYHKAPI